MNYNSINRYFIRFGEIPENCVSYSWNTEGEQTGVETGVSVYDASYIDGKWHIVIPQPISEKGLNTLYGFLLYQKRNVFVVTGDVVGYGSDNEPVIENPVIIEEITDIF